MSDKELTFEKAMEKCDVVLNNIQEENLQAIADSKMASEPRRNKYIDNRFKRNNYGSFKDNLQRYPAINTRS